MGVFTAYFDASGSPDDPYVHYLTVAGFIATADQWSLFDRRWKKILKKYGVAKLHMKDFSHSRGEFVGWDVDPKKSWRPLMIGSLVTLLQRMMRHSFATTISLDDYRENEKTYHIRKVASPLAIAGMMVMDNLKEVAISLPIKKLLVLFEDGDTDQRNLEVWVRGLGFHPNFIPKDDIKAFEACDLLAYEHLQASKKVMPRPGVYALEDLRKSFPQIGTFTMFEMPTGNYDKGLGVGKVWYKLPIWLQKNQGKWLFDGGGGYQVVPQTGYRNFPYTGWLIKRELSKQWELGAEIFAHGAEGSAAAQTQSSTMIDVGGYYHFTRNTNEQFLFCYGHSVAGQTENYAYVGMYWTWGKDAKSDTPDNKNTPNANLLFPAPPNRNGL